MSWLANHEISLPTFETQNAKTFFYVQLRKRNIPGSKTNGAAVKSTSNSCVVTACRSYSEFRSLWKDLQHLTKAPDHLNSVLPMPHHHRDFEVPATSKCAYQCSCQAVQTCRNCSSSDSTLVKPRPRSSSGFLKSLLPDLRICMCGTVCCSFNGLQFLLKHYPFPSKNVLRRTSYSTIDLRRQALEKFMQLICNYFISFENSFLDQAEQVEKCYVLHRLATFIGYCNGVDHVNDHYEERSCSEPLMQCNTRANTNQSQNNMKHQASLPYTPSQTHKNCSFDDDVMVDPANHPKIVLYPQNENEVVNVTQPLKMKQPPSRASSMRQINTTSTNITHEHIFSHKSYGEPQRKAKMDSFLFDFSRRTNKEFASNIMEGSPDENAIQESDVHLWELALYNASHAGIAQAVEAILYFGVSPNAVMEDGSSSLHAACRGNHVEVVQVLLEHECYLDVNLRDSKGMTALLYTVNENNVHIARLLLQAGANPNLCNTLNVSPVHMAVALQSTIMLRLLFEYDVDVNQQLSVNGRPPLHLAILSGSYLLCDILLKHGADVFLLNHDNNDARALALQTKHQAIAELCTKFSGLIAPNIDKQLSFQYSELVGNRNPSFRSNIPKALPKRQNTKWEAKFEQAEQFLLQRRLAFDKRKNLNCPRISSDSFRSTSTESVDISVVADEAGQRYALL